jgi:glycosyltransferase involved in cell wall biosynthesis
MTVDVTCSAPVDLIQTPEPPVANRGVAQGGLFQSERESPVVLETRVVTGSGGGPDKTILNTPRFFASEGYRVLCAYMHPPGDRGFEQLRAKAQAWKAPLFPVPDRGPWDWQVIWRLLDICRRERVRIWHGHDYKSNALGLIVRRFWPMRLVTTVHGWVEETRRTPLYYGIDKLCLPRYESVICVSDDLHEKCLASGVPGPRCVVVENGIDADQFSRRRTTAVAKKLLGLPAPSSKQIIGSAGRLSPEKGFDNLIRAAHDLIRRGFDVELVVAGEGDEQSRLQALSESLGVASRVHLLGYVADLRSFYEAIDVFALSSLREGLPNVLLEAMAMGVPVVATRIAGIPRLITDGENGLLVEAGSVDQLVNALERVLTDDATGNQFGARGRMTVEGRYNFAGRIRKIRAIYDALLNKSPVSQSQAAN